jgi:alanyl-tRNA synthetase
MMNRKKLIEEYIEFFKSKGHKEIKNSSLIPENDPTVLFTTAGMHPLVPYLLGQPHPQGKRLVNIQRCIRTGDIEEVGDTTHHTFFEMLGNWSLGDYFKEEAIQMSSEFLTKILKIPREKLAVTVFAGNKEIPRDEKSAELWRDLKIPKERIKYLEDNIWGPAGSTGPCGPDTEMFYWSLKDEKAPEEFNPNDLNSKTGGEKWVEIWNDVLMQYNKDEKGNYKEAKQKNIDTGMGVERVLASINNLDDNYLGEVWHPIIKEIEKLSKKLYDNNKKQMRIISDHIKAAVFIIADGVVPGNTEQGYVLRRLIRRAIRYGRLLGIEDFTEKIAEPIFKIYSDYEHLQKKKKQIIEELRAEEEKFNKTLEKGLNKFNKISKNKKLSGVEAFLLYQSYGFPIEMTEELSKENNVKLDIEDFQRELEKHKKLSQTASAGKFKSGLADNKEETTKLHTTAHLLLQALKIILKDENIIQRGSNITAERLRLDFSFPRKLTDKEIEDIEDLVNAQIELAQEVKCEFMSPSEAKKKGASGTFDDKYGDKVSVYSIGNFSKEICAGPHITNTKELGRFKIKKEESSGSGVRRIKAILE